MSARGVYYNEIDPYAAQWLRHLIARNLIAPGDVDERDIRQVHPDDLRGYRQCHFFAGIGGWALAMRLAGWPDDRPAWTGSCPCQPFSNAGQRKGTSDERHLWPHWFRLIRECRPRVVFGEQVASAEVIGSELEASFVIAVQRGDFARANKLAKRLAQSRSFHFHPRWVDGIRADVEAINYAFRYAVLGAHSAGAPHIRQRLWFVADADFQRRPQHALLRQEQINNPEIAGCGEARQHRQTNGLWRDADWLRCRDGKWRPVEPGTFPLAHGVPARVGRLRAYGNAISPQVAAQFIAAMMEPAA